MSSNPSGNKKFASLGSGSQARFLSRGVDAVVPVNEQGNNSKDVNGTVSVANVNVDEEMVVLDSNVVKATPKKSKKTGEVGNVLVQMKSGSKDVVSGGVLPKASEVRKSTGKSSSKVIGGPPLPSDWVPMNHPFDSAVQPLLKDIYGSTNADVDNVLGIVETPKQYREVYLSRLFRHLYVPFLAPRSEYTDIWPCCGNEQPIAPVGSSVGTALVANIGGKRQLTRAAMSSLHMYAKLTTDMDEMHHYSIHDFFEISKSSVYSCYFRLQGPGSIMLARMAWNSAMREDYITGALARWLAHRFGWIDVAYTTADGSKVDIDLTCIPYSPTMHMAKQIGYENGHSCPPAVDTVPISTWTEITPAIINSEYFIHQWRAQLLRGLVILELERQEWFLLENKLTLQQLVQKALQSVPMMSALPLDLVELGVLPVSPEIPFSRSFLTTLYTLPVVVTPGVLKAYLQLVLPTGATDASTSSITKKNASSAYSQVYDEAALSGEQFCPRDTDTPVLPSDRTPSKAYPVYTDEMNDESLPGATNEAVLSINPYAFQPHVNINRQYLPEDLPKVYHPSFAKAPIAVTGSVASMPLHNRPMVELLQKKYAVTRGYGAYTAALTSPTALAKEITLFELYYSTQKDLLCEVSNLEQANGMLDLDQGTAISKDSLVYLDTHRLVYLLPLPAQRALYCSFEFPKQLQHEVVLANDRTYNVVQYPTTFGCTRTFEKLHTMVATKQPQIVVSKGTCVEHTTRVETSVPILKVGATEMVCREYSNIDWCNTIDKVNPFAIKCTNGSTPVYNIAKYGVIADLLAYDSISGVHVKTPISVFHLILQEYSVGNGFTPLIDQRGEVPVSLEMKYHTLFFNGEDTSSIVYIDNHANSVILDDMYTDTTSGTNSATNNNIHNNEGKKSQVKKVDSLSSLKKTDGSFRVSLLSDITSIKDISSSEAYITRSRKKQLTTAHVTKSYTLLRQILLHNLHATMKYSIQRTMENYDLDKLIATQLGEERGYESVTMVKLPNGINNVSNDLTRSSGVFSHIYWDITVEEISKYVKVVLAHKPAWHVDEHGVQQDYLEKDVYSLVKEGDEQLAQSLCPLDSVHMNPSDLCIGHHQDQSPKQWEDGYLCTSDASMVVKSHQSSIMDKKKTHTVLNTGGYNYGAEWVPMTSTSSLVADVTKECDILNTQYLGVAVRKTCTIIDPGFRDRDSTPGEDQVTIERGFEHQIGVYDTATGGQIVAIGYVSSQVESCHRLLRTHVDSTCTEVMQQQKKSLNIRQLSQDPYSGASTQTAVLHPEGCMDDAQSARFSAYQCTNVQHKLKNRNHSSTYDIRNSHRTTVHPANHHIQIWKHTEHGAAMDLSLSWLGPGDFEYHFPEVPVSTQQGGQQQIYKNCPPPKKGPQGYVVSMKWVDNAAVAYQGESSLDYKQKTYLPRLGLQCTLFSDGKLYLIAVPHPQAIRTAQNIDTEHPIDIPIACLPYIELKQNSSNIPFTAFDMTVAPLCPSHHDSAAMFHNGSQKTIHNDQCIWNFIISAGGMNGVVSQFNLGIQLPSMYKEQATCLYPLETTTLPSIGYTNSVIDSITVAKYHVQSHPTVHKISQLNTASTQKVCIRTSSPLFVVGTNTGYLKIYANMQQLLFSVDVPTQSVRNACILSHSLYIGKQVSEQIYSEIVKTSAPAEILVVNDANTHAYTILQSSEDTPKIMHLKGCASLMSITSVDSSLPTNVPNNTLRAKKYSSNVSFAAPAYTPRSAFQKLDESILPTADCIVYKANKSKLEITYNRQKDKSIVLDTELGKHQLVQSATVTYQPDYVSAKLLLYNLTTFGVSRQILSEEKTPGKLFRTAKTCLDCRFDPHTRKYQIIAGTIFGQVSLTGIYNIADTVMMSGTETSLLLDTYNGAWCTIQDETEAAATYTDRHPTLEPRVIVKNVLTLPCTKDSYSHWDTKATESPNMLLHTFDNTIARDKWNCKNQQTDASIAPRASCQMGCLDQCICYDVALMLEHGYLNDYLYITSVSMNPNIYPKTTSILAAAVYKLNAIVILHK